MYKNNDLLINGVYYNTEESFRINNNANVKTEEFGNQKIVVIDDFYSDPDLVRNIALSSTASKLANIGYPGFRSTLVVNQEFNLKFFFNIMKKYYNGMTFYPTTLHEVNFNLTKSAEVYNWDQEEHGRACHPHMDERESVKYSAIVFLNKDDEYTAGVNGTAFYKHIPTGVSNLDYKVKRFYKKAGYKNINDIFFQDETAHCTDWVNDGNQYWELLHLAQMKYNRLVLYPASYFHNAYYNNDDFSNPNPATGHRIVQAIFLRGRD